MQHIFETKRLWIKVATLEQLKLLRDNRTVFHQQMQGTYDGEPIEGFIAEYLNEQISIIEKDADAWMYNAFWFLQRKSDGVIVGSMAFKGYPNENGEVEIGYGLNEKYEHQGYMTEAVAPACEWALQQPNVKNVIAETDPDGSGFASRNILYKNGFFRYRFGDAYWFRKRPEGNPLCEEIIFITNRALWETENLITGVSDEIWNKRYDGIPTWKYLYHMLFSMDRWYINPADENEQEKVYGTELANLNSIPPIDQLLTREQILTYFHQIAEKIAAYLTVVTDEDLSEKPEHCEMTRFRLILGQIRHWHRHMGVVYGFVIEDQGKWPYVLNMCGDYPKTGMPNFY